MCFSKGTGKSYQNHKILHQPNKTLSYTIFIEQLHYSKYSSGAQKTTMNNIVRALTALTITCFKWKKE